jgi:hypothetical protein
MKSSLFNQILQAQWFKITANLLVLILSVYFIAKRLGDDSLWLSLQNLNIRLPWWIFPSLTFFWFLNFQLDIKLWQKAVSGFHKINARAAFADNLKFYTYAFISPANSGGLLARINRYISRRDRAWALISSTQLGTARYMARISIGGSLSVYLVVNYLATQPLAIFLSIAFALITIIIILNLGRLVRFKWLRRFTFLKKLVPKPSRKNRFKNTLFYLACMRFVSFNIQLVLILYIFGAPLSLEMLINVPSFFFVSTLIPALPAFDFIVKGAVGLLAFDYFNQMPDILLVSTTLLWIMNWAIPALAGVFVKRKKRPVAKDLN